MGELCKIASYGMEETFVAVFRFSDRDGQQVL